MNDVENSSRNWLDDQLDVGSRKGMLLHRPIDAELLVEMRETAEDLGRVPAILSYDWLYVATMRSKLWRLAVRKHSEAQHVKVVGLTRVSDIVGIFPNLLLASDTDARGQIVSQDSAFQGFGPQGKNLDLDLSERDRLWASGQSDSEILLCSPGRSMIRRMSIDVSAGPQPSPYAVEVLSDIRVGFEPEGHAVCFDPFDSAIAATARVTDGLVLQFLGQGPEENRPEISLGSSSIALLADITRPIKRLTQMRNVQSAFMTVDAEDGHLRKHVIADDGSEHATATRLPKSLRDSPVRLAALSFRWKETVALWSPPSRGITFWQAKESPTRGMEEGDWIS